MIQDSKNTALNLRREVAEALETLRELSNQAQSWAILVDKATPRNKVTILYAADICEGNERIEAAIRTVEKFPHLIELVQDDEGDLRKLSNRLKKILGSANEEYRKIIG